MDLVNKVAETFRNLREEADLPDHSASDEFVAEEFIKYLGKQNLYIVEDSGVHEVTFSETSYGLKHPISCRSNLIGCAYHEYLSNMVDEPDQSPGTYIMEFVLESDGWSVPKYTLKEN